MNVELMKGLVAFIVVLLAQALVLNHIHLFGCATPMVYVYLVLLFRRGYARQVGCAGMELPAGSDHRHLLEYARCRCRFDDICGLAAALFAGVVRSA